MMQGTITLADLEAIAEQYGVECEISRGDKHHAWVVEYDHDTEEYLTGEEACEAIRAYGSGSR